MNADDPGFEEQRNQMVQNQLIVRGIRDPAVIKAFTRVPRHKFIPQPYSVDGYADCPLPIGEGQTISQPYMVALMTESLNLTHKSQVLEIGTGSGYQAAILSEICRKVFTVERNGVLSERAEEILGKEGYENIVFKHDDGTGGWGSGTLFDGIIVTAAAPHIPEALKEQLADKGTLIIPVGPRFSQMLVVVTRQGDTFKERNICGCVFVPLIGKDGWQE